MKQQISVLCLLSSVLCFLPGCGNLLPEPQPDNTRYFTLSTPPAGPALGGGATVRPVRLAGHLHRRALAVRVSEHEVAYLDELQWAESLDDAITQIFRTRLAGVGAGSTVSVQVDRCELVRYDGNRVELAASYTIFLPTGTAAAGMEPKRGNFTSSPRIWDGKSYGALVGEIRAAVDELGDTLAAALAPGVPEQK
jgi:hypothetical protein